MHNWRVIIINRILKLIVIFTICIILSFWFLRQNNKIIDISKDKSVQNEVSVNNSNTNVKQIISDLCSDKFQGRLTGSKGNDEVSKYIEKIFKDLELSTLFDNSYYHKYYQNIVSAYNDNSSDSRIDGVNNVVGVIKGTDSKKAVVISAHFDHIGYINGKIVRGALDNASGVATLIEIAHTLKERSNETLFNMDIVICAFNGEEEALQGSKAFVNDIKSKGAYENLYNINIDCIGAKNGGRLALKNSNNVSSKLYNHIKITMKKHNIEVVDIKIKGHSDNMSFERAKIPNVFFVQENIERLVHVHTDTPDILDYDQIKKISNAICDFIKTNDGVIF